MTITCPELTPEDLDRHRYFYVSASGPGFYADKTWMVRADLCRAATMGAARLIVEAYVLGHEIDQIVLEPIQTHD